MLPNWAKKSKIGLLLKSKSLVYFCDALSIKFCVLRAETFRLQKIIELVFYFFEPLNSKQNSKESKSKHRKII